MATEPALIDVLSSFSTATESALAGLPDASALLPLKDGISLLDAKNEIFLAYLQALALRNLNVIRSVKAGGDADEANNLSENLTKKLVEHRVYLERGVRPLEAKIRYQVDKVVKAADDAERAAEKKAGSATQEHKSTKHTANGAPDEDDHDDISDASGDEEADALAYRPSRAAFGGPAGKDKDSVRRMASKQDGVYRPPRISATAMPTTESRERRERRPGRSATVDEYISNELSSAPMAEPSIGSTIADGGRRTKNARQQAEEQERRDYEESNLVRLPAPSKRDKSKQDRVQKGGGFGGEEWRGLDQSLDRIGDLTKRRGGKSSAFDRSKRRRDVGDRDRDDGMGGAFEIKKRRLEKKSKR